MKRNTLIFLSIFVFFSLCSIQADDSNSALDAHSYLKGRIEVANKRYASFAYVLELLTQAQAQTLVETGTTRHGRRNFAGDGGATIIFGHWASQNGASLYSVDICPNAVKQARRATKFYAKHIQFTCDDSITFLENFGKPIDFLYLDSFDFELDNPLPSQEHHLKEILAAYPWLHKNSIVMIDDCDLPHGGKGKFVIDYLINKGWRICYEGYQVILVPEKQEENLPL